jgi:hypothetical protein
MLIKGYINQLCGETPTDLRMKVLDPTTTFVGLTITLTETQRKAAINSAYHTSRDAPHARELEDWLKSQPQSFANLGINADS